MTGKNIATVILLLLANWIWITCVWLYVRFGTMDMTTILFQLKVPIDGADNSNFYEIFILLFTIGPAALLLEVGTLFLLAWIRRKRVERGESGKVLAKSIALRRIYAIIILTCAIIFIGYRLHFVKYIVHQFGDSPIYIDEYVDPKNVTEQLVLTTEKPRNLIYIYMESMEISYTDKEHGGIAGDDMIPEMTQLALDNICFSPKESGQLNGAYAAVGTTWTMGSLVAQTSGVPLTIGVGNNALGKRKYQTFLPGVYTIGETLRKQGYELGFLIGSEKEFSGANIYLRTHGDYDIKDYNTYLDNGRLPSGYHEWWGFEDEKLYEYAKEEISEMAKGDKPFMYTFMTMDTHFTNGYFCRLCEHHYDSQYSNVISCASRQLDSFLGWLREQPYYENTTVIIVGDHPTMDTKYVRNLEEYDKKYIRRSYCAILNSAVPYTLDYAREFTQMDMYPTTLAALGYTIPGDRLALGVNLFSNTPTLLEKYGRTDLDNLLEERSDFYDKLTYGE